MFIFDNKPSDPTIIEDVIDKGQIEIVIDGKTWRQLMRDETLYTKFKKSSICNNAV